MQTASDSPNGEEKVPGWWKVGLHLLRSSKTPNSKSIPPEESESPKKKKGRNESRKRPSSSDSHLPLNGFKRKRGPSKGSGYVNSASLLPFTGEHNSAVASVVDALHMAFLRKEGGALENGIISEFHAFDNMVHEDVCATVEALIVKVEKNVKRHSSTVLSSSAFMSCSH